MKSKIYKRGIFFLGLLLINGILLSAQENNGNSIQERPLTGLTGIKTEGASNVLLTQGNENKVKIEAPEKYINSIKSEINDGVLTLSGKVEKAIRIEITVSDLKTIEITGASEIKSTNVITSDNLKVKIYGSGDLKMDVTVTKLVVQIDGAGEAKLKGTAESVDYTISGAGDIKAGELQCKKCNVNISGAGEAKLNVTDELTANVSGAGSVKYKGEPKVINKNISGAGEFGTYTSDVTSDTTRFKLGTRRVEIINDDDSTHHHRSGYKNDFKAYWGGVSLGMNSYMNVNNKLDVPVGYDYMELNQAKSLVVNINPIEKSFSIVKNHVNLVTGLGFELNNYRFEKDYRLLPDSSFICAVKDSAINYKKNKLMVSFLNVPLLIQFDTKQNKHGKTFHVSVGVIGGIKLGSHTKQVYEADGVEYKPKTHDDFNLSQLRYGLMARIGYGKLDFFASYALSPFFNDYEGPQLYPVSAGITLAGF